MSFNSATGTISGTPYRQSAATDYTVTASNTSGISTASVNIKVSAAFAAPHISYPGPQNYSINAVISPLGPVNSGGPVATKTTQVIVADISSQTNGIAVDAAGNIYVAGNFTNNIVKIPADGSPNVIFATGFSTQIGVAVDAAGNVYVADSGNNCIKEIPATGGTPVIIAAGFTHPNGVAVDASGNIYVLQSYNADVIKLPPGGGAPIYLGNAQLNFPQYMAVDAAGNVYVSNKGNAKLVKIAGDGSSVTTLASSVSLTGVAVDNIGNVYYADNQLNTVEMVSSNGGTPVRIGSGFKSPAGLGVDAAGNLFVNDVLNYVVKEEVFGGYKLWPSLPAGVKFNSTTGVISGKPTATSPSTIYTIAASNITGSSIAKVNIAAQNGNAYLLNLSVNSVTFIPPFKYMRFDYTADPVINSVTSLSVTPVSVDPAATITVNGIAALSGAAQNVPLSVGSNMITIVVTGVGGVNSQTYTISITRLPSPDANLSGLVPDVGTLSPAFDPGTTGYTLTVGGSVASISFTPITEDHTANVTVNGAVVISNTSSAPISLNPGTNAVNVVVTAADGITVKTYSVVVTRTPATGYAVLTGLVPTRGTLSPAFNAGTFSYTVSVPDFINLWGVRPRAGSTASITVNGAPVVSGNVSAAIALNPGINTVTVVVSAGGVSTSYVLTVTRAPSADAGLINLAPSHGTLSPAFDAATYSYTTSVGNATKLFWLRPKAASQQATITVNGLPVISDTVSSTITLDVGTNVITTVVTAGDGSTQKTYTVTVTRAPSGDASLFYLVPSKGTLSPAFDPSITSYTVSVDNSVGFFSLRVKTSSQAATIEVNGDVVAFNTLSPPVSLNVGGNLISVNITAEDGINTETYIVNVTRAAPPLNAVYQPVSVTTPTDRPQMMGEEITVHQGLSPNGDGINDFLMIDGIANYPDNKLLIINRSGQLIFEAKGYDNSTKVFDGHSNKNGVMQLPGTYFYSVEYTASGIVKHKTGYIVLKY